jgi:hypothetical protein
MKFKEQLVKLLGKKMTDEERLKKEEELIKKDNERILKEIKKEYLDAEKILKKKGLKVIAEGEGDVKFSDGSVIRYTVFTDTIGKTVGYESALYKQYAKIFHNNARKALAEKEKKEKLLYPIKCYESEEKYEMWN